MRRRSIYLEAALCLLFAGWGACAPPAAAAPTDGDRFQISGTVVNARTGAPLASAHVVAFEAERDAAPQTRTRGSGPPGAEGTRQQRSGRTRATQDLSADTDTRGHFVLTVPGAGSWRLLASARGFRQQSYDEHDGFTAAVVLTESAPTYGLTMRLQPDALLTGLVRDESGDPVERAQVMVERLPPTYAGAETPGTPRIVGNAMTDDRGRFEVSSLAPGDYRVHVQATPWYAAAATGNRGPQTASDSPDPSLDLVYAPTWYPGTADRAGAEVLTLHAGEEREADIQMTAIPAVHVQVPLPPAAEQAATTRGGQQRSFPQGVVFMRVSDTGFDFVNQGFRQGAENSVDSGGLTPGLYDVRIGSGGFGGPFDNSTAQDVREIEIRPGTTGVVSLADAIPLIRVTISVDGVPEEQVRQLYLVDTHTGRRIQATAPNALRPRPMQRLPRNDQTSVPEEPQAPVTHDHVALVPPGTYDLYIQNGQAYVVSVSATEAKATGRTVEISGGSPQLDLHAASGRAVVDGTVQLSGKPLEGAMVVLVPATLGQPGDLDRTYRDETNTDGSFHLRAVIPGQYILIAIDHGWDVDWHDPATLTRYLEHGLPLDLTAGKSVSEALTAQLP